MKGSKVNIVELFPPAVQSQSRLSDDFIWSTDQLLAELHDEKHQPDIKDGRSIGMPLDQFTEEAYQGLAAGKEQVPIGMAAEAFEKFETRRQDQFQAMIEAMKS